jgi:hypothetical protein
MTWSSVWTAPTATATSASSTRPPASAGPSAWTPPRKPSGNGSWNCASNIRRPGSASAWKQPAGHLLGFLGVDPWIALHPINSITLQKYREASVTSRAEDDTQDADYLADLLLNHHDSWIPGQRWWRRRELNPRP